MTRERWDEHSTEFGLWLRKQNEIDSGKGYIATNIDYLWMNYKNQKWMLIEEKRYNSDVKFPQTKMFDLIDKACKSDKNYQGFHVLKFEKTNPGDGRIYLNGKEVTRNELINFLRFDNEQ